MPPIVWFIFLRVWLVQKRGKLLLGSNGSKRTRLAASSFQDERFGHSLRPSKALARPWFGS